MPTTTCATCQRPFQTADKRAKYCSRDCYYQSKRGRSRPDLRKPLVVRPCEFCGEPFEARRASTDRKQARFCSRQCAQSSRSTGTEIAPLADAQAGYIAGLVDGEGSIVLFREKKGRPTVKMHVNVASCDRVVLEWLIATTGCGGITAKRPTDPSRHRVGYHWNLTPQASRSLLEAIKPYLVIKREQAELAIEFQRRRESGDPDTGWQDDARQRMAFLNRRGPR